MDRFGFPTFPKPVEGTPGDPAVIRFKKQAPPLETSLKAWREVDHQGQPEGDPIPIPNALLPAGGGHKAWEIHFLIPPLGEHLYLLAEAYWADEEECSQQPDLGSQYAAWTFHVRSP